MNRHPSLSHAARMPEPILPSSDLGLTWRSITVDDIESWNELVQAIEAHDQPSERSDQDELLDTLTGASYKDPQRDSLIGFDGDGVARAFGHLSTAACHDVAARLPLRRRAP